MICQKCGKETDNIAYCDNCLNKLKQDIKSLDKKIKLNPNDAQLYNEHGLINYALGEYQNAISDYHIAIKYASNDTELSEFYRNRGLARNKLSYGTKEAIKDFNNAIKKNPNDAESYYGRGIAKCIDDRNWYVAKTEEGMADFNKAIELNPNEPKYYYARGRVTNSITDFETAHKLGFETADLFYQMFLLTEKDKSIEYISKSIAIDPKNPKYYYARGCKEIEMKQYVEGITDYITVVKLNHTYFTTESYYIDENKYKKYIRDCDEAIKLDANNSDFYYFRGYIKMLLHKNKDAISDYNKCIKLDPNNIQAYLDRGNIYYYNDNYKNAVADFEEYLKLDPDNTEVKYDLKFAQILATK